MTPKPKRAECSALQTKRVYDTLLYVSLVLVGYTPKTSTIPSPAKRDKHREYVVETEPAFVMQISPRASRCSQGEGGYSILLT